MRAPWIRRMIAAILLLALLAFAASELADRNPAWNAPIASTERYSQASFGRWLEQDLERAKGFGEFEAFLAAHEVSGVVPNWQLLRTDINDRAPCPRPAFLLPPRRDWPNIVPALTLLKNHVIAEVGRLEVVSSYRTEAFNACVNGARRSRHLSNSAVDLVTVAERDNRSLFTRLCALHRRLGPASRFGLGAYFDPLKDGNNSRGRFHVDATGYRTWGFSKQAESSGCRLLLEQQT